jgi:pyruvate dehydrogenase E1 component
VRGNGKIIQELEGVFRGAGWNVIKVIWGRQWDELLALDVDGALVKRMNEVPDGQMQTYTAKGVEFVREDFFNADPKLKEIADRFTDDQLGRLTRGGHDYRKVYAAFKAATETTGCADRHPGADRQGLDAGPGLRGPQRRPPDEEAVLRGAEVLP